MTLPTMELISKFNQLIQLRWFTLSAQYSETYEKYHFPYYTDVIIFQTMSCQAGNKKTEFSIRMASELCQFHLCIIMCPRSYLNRHKEYRYGNISYTECFMNSDEYKRFVEEMVKLKKNCKFLKDYKTFVQMPCFYFEKIAFYSKI